MFATTTTKFVCCKESWRSRRASNLSKFRFSTCVRPRRREVSSEIFSSFERCSAILHSLHHHTTMSMMRHVVAATAVLLLGLLFTSTTQAQHLRSIPQSSPCNDATDESSCFATTDPDSGESCRWCQCQAIPSECLTPAQAALAPPGVFDCSTSSSSNGEPSFSKNISNWWQIQWMQMCAMPIPKVDTSVSRAVNTMKMEKTSTCFIGCLTSVIRKRTRMT